METLASRLRRLGAPTGSLDESKLQLAGEVVRQLLTAIHSACFASPDPHATLTDEVDTRQLLARMAAAGRGEQQQQEQHDREGRAVGEDLPLLVLAHYYRTTLEWVASCILKIKPPAKNAQGSGAAAPAKGSKPGAGGKGKAQQAAADAGEAPPQAAAPDPRQHYASCVSALWRLLQDLVAQGGPALAALREGAVPGSLLPAAAQCLRGVRSCHEQPEEAAVELQGCVRCVLQRLSVLGVLRPSLEQCTALLSAVLEERPDAGQTDGAQRAACWAGLCAAALRLTHGTVVSHPSPKRVWQALVVPQLLLPLLAAAAPHEGLAGALQLVLGGVRGAGGGGGGGGAAGALRGLGGAADGAGPAAGAAGAAMGELEQAAQQLLAAVLFHDAHVGGLAEVFHSLASHGDPDGAKGAAEGAGGKGGKAPGGSDPAPGSAAGAGAAGGAAVAAGSAGGAAAPGCSLPGFAAAVCRSYPGQLLQILAEAQVQRGACGTAAEGAGSSWRHGGTLAASLPWLLRSYCRAVARHRRAVAADAAAAATAFSAGGGKSAAHKGAGAGDGGDGAGGEDAAALGGHGGSAKALAAAEFEAVAVLSRVLLQPPVGPAGAAAAAAGGKEGKRPAKRQKTGGAAVAEGGVGAAGAGAAVAVVKEEEGSTPPWRLVAAAAVLATGRAVGAYQPTRDVSGAQRAALAALADQVVAASSTSSSSSSSTAAAASDAAAAAGRAAAGGGVGGCTLPLAASLALCALLDLEHRVVTPHLESMWSLLWRSAAAPPRSPSTRAAQHAPAAATPAGSHRKGKKDKQSSHAPTPGAGADPAAGAAGGCYDPASAGAATAAAVLQRMVRAFGELRQLRALLESLSAALRACGSRLDSGGSGGSSSGGGGGSTGWGLVASRLVERGEVQAAVRGAVASLPTGQLPSLIEWVAADLVLWLPHADGAGSAPGGDDVQDGGGGGAGGAAAAPAALPDLLLAAAGLYDTVLTGLRVDLTTALPASRANRRLLAALAPPLLAAARRYAKHREGGGGGGADGGAADAGAQGLAGGGGAAALPAARLAALLLVYGAVVRCDAVCSGLHPEVVPLQQQHISPAAPGGAQDSAPGGYLAAAAAHCGAHPAGAAAAPAGSTPEEVERALKKLRKALKGAGADGYRRGPLVALAQLALPPAVAVAAGGGGGGTGGEGAGAGGVAGWAPGAAEARLALAVYRCCLQRAQVLHERSVRRAHACPPAPSAPAAAAAAEASAATLGSPAAEEEAEELRALAALLLSPFSPSAAAHASCTGPPASAAAPTHTHTHTVGAAARRAPPALHARAAAGAGALCSMWHDAMALLGSTAAWAQPGHLAEALRLGVAASAAPPWGRVRAAGPGAAAAPDRHVRAPRAGADEPALLLRLVQPTSSACLRSREYQSLPGVRQALPYAWMAAAGAALGDVIAAVRDVAGAAPPAAGGGGEGGGGGGGGGKAVKRARSEVGAGGEAGEHGILAVQSEARLAALGAVVRELQQAEAARELGGGGEEAGEGAGVGKCRKRLRKLLGQQAEQLAQLACSHTLAHPRGVDGAGAAPVAAEPAAAAVAAAAAAAALHRLRCLLASCDALVLELLSKRAVKALTAQLTGCLAALTEALALLCVLRPAAPQPLHALRREALLAARACGATLRRVLVSGARVLGAGGAAGAGGPAAGAGGGKGVLAGLFDEAAPAAAWLVAVAEVVTLEAAQQDGAAAGSTAAQQAAAEEAGGAAAGVRLPLSCQVAHAAGALMDALLAPRGAGGDTSAAVQLPGAAASSLELCGSLLDRVRAAAGAAAAGPRAGKAGEGAKGAKRRKAEAGGGSDGEGAGAGEAPAALVALRCRLVLSAVRAAAAEAAAVTAATTGQLGAKEDGKAGAGKAGKARGDGEGAAAAAEAVASGELINGVVRLGQRAREALRSCVGDAAAAAARDAAAGTTGSDCSSASRAVLLLRAALCLSACGAEADRLSAAAHAGGQQQHQQAAEPTGKGKPTRGSAAAASCTPPAATELLAGVHQARGWAVAERRLLAAACGAGRDDGDGGGDASGGGDLAASTGADAEVVAEPLEHCLSVVYGTTEWLPHLALPGGGGGGSDNDVAGGGSGGADVSAADVMEQLVLALQGLMAAMAPPSAVRRSRAAGGGGSGSGGAWSVLLVDVAEAGAAARSRTLLLESLRHALSRGGRATLPSVLRLLCGQLTHGSLCASPEALLPPAHCLLLVLEALYDPWVTRELSAQGRQITEVLAQVLGAVMGREAAGDLQVDPQQHGQLEQQMASAGAAPGRAAVEAALCCVLRCLESVLGREATFRLTPTHVTAALSAVANLAASSQLLAPVTLTPAAAPHPGGGKHLPHASSRPAADAQPGGLPRAAEAHGEARVAAGDAHMLHAGCCSVLAAAVRHHTGTASHCMAPVVQGARSLLRRIEAWALELRRSQRQLQLQGGAAGGGGVREVAAAAEGLHACAAALSRVYEAVSEHPKTLGKYGIHLLADYVVHAATPLPSLALLQHDAEQGGDPWAGGAGPTGHPGGGAVPASAADAVSDALDAAAAAGVVVWAGAVGGGPSAGDAGREGAGWAGAAGAGGGGGGGATLLPAAAHLALREGAFYLLSCLEQQQLQHLHMALGVGAGDAGQGGQGAARRGALGQLRKEYESGFKYTGKV